MGSLWRIRSSTMLHMVVVCPIISMAVAFLGRIRLGPKTKARFCTCIKFVSLYVATRPAQRTSLGQKKNRRDCSFHLNSSFLLHHHLLLPIKSTRYCSSTWFSCGKEFTSCLISSTACSLFNSLASRKRSRKRTRQCVGF